MAKKKKRYGYKDGDENARFAPGGSAASEWEEEQRQSFTMGRTINPSDTSKRFNTEQDIENYKPIKTETYQSYMAQKLAQAKANNPKSKVHITANDLSSYSNARAKLYNIDPRANLKSQSEFTSQYKSSVDKKARLNDMVQLAQGLDLSNTQDLVRKSYNDLGAVEGLANTRTNAEGLLKRVEEYRKLYGDSKELKTLETRAKGIQDYINTNAKGGSAVSQAVFDEANAPVVKSMYDTKTQTRDEIKAKNKAISDANIEEKYGRPGDLGYEGVKNIKAETPAEADWKEEKQLQLDPFKKYEDNKKEIESLENDGKMPLGNQNGVGYQDEQKEKDNRINALREQNAQILSQYAEDIIAKANLTDSERRKLESGRSFDLSDNEFRWDIGDKAANEVTLNRKEMIDVLTKRGISEEEASLLLDYENELDKENERQAAINAGELRRRTDSELGNLTEDIARTIGQPIISPLEKVMGVSGEYAHAEQLGRQQAREKYYEDDAIGKALYDFGETAGTIVGSSLLGGAAAVPFTTKAVEDSYYNALDKGATESDAMNYAASNGIITGIIYGIGLKGVNKLLSKSVKGSVVEGLAKEIVEGKPTSSLGKAILKSVGTNAVKEGGIFAGLTTTTQVADTLNQVVNLGKKSDFNQMVEAYKQQGMSEDEAWQNTVLDISKQIGQGALESFASGAIMGAGGAVIGNIRQATSGGQRLPENTLLRSEEGTPLRDSQGREILDDNGQPIRVQQGLNIDRDGNVLNRNISEEVNVTESENGVPIIDSNGNQVTVNGKPIRAERTTLSGAEAYNKLRNEYESARVGLENIQERIDGLWNDYKEQGFSNPEEVADFEKVRAKFNKDYVHVVNKAKAILGEYKPISARDKQDLLEGKKKLEDFREDLDTVNPSSEEVKSEVDDLKAEVDTQIDNIDTVVETTDIVEPSEIVEPTEMVEPVETPIERAENVDLSNLNDRQSEIAEIGAKYNLPEDTIKSMVANDNAQISPRLYANEYSKMYLLGKQETIDSIEDAIRRNPEVRDTIQKIGTQAAGSAFSEGNTPRIEKILRPETKPKGRLVVDFQETLEEAKVHQVLRRYAKASGIDIAVTNDMGKYTNQGKAQGIAFLNNGKIVLNRDVANILGTADHEILGHFGKALAPKAYKELASIIVDTYQKDLGIRGYDKFIQNLKAEAKEQGLYLTESDAQEEAIAYGLETMAMNTDAMEKFIDRLQDSTMTEAEKKTILDKLKEFVKHVIDTLKQRLKDARVRTGTESMLKADIDAEKVAEAKLKVYEEIRSNLENLTESKGEVSEKGKYSFAGTNSKTADLVKLDEAKKMYDELSKDKSLKSYQVSQRVMDKTGWFKGLDGQWKYEIDNDTFKFKDNIVSKEVKTIGDIIEDKKLFAAYPELKDIKIEQFPSKISRGTFYPGDNEILLNEMYFWKGRAKNYNYQMNKIKNNPIYQEYENAFDKYMNNETTNGINPGIYYSQAREKALPLIEKLKSLKTSKEIDNTKNYHVYKNKQEELKKVLLHELQHAIQFKEGFASGASIDYWEDIKNIGRTIIDNKEEADLDTKLMDLVSEYLEDVGTNEYIQPIKIAHIANKFFERAVRESDKESAIEYIRDYQRAKKRVPDEVFAKYYPKFKAIEEARDNFETKIKERNERTASDLYRNTAGEIEARDVAERYENYSRDGYDHKGIPETAVGGLKDNDKTVFADLHSRVANDEDVKYSLTPEQQQLSKDYDQAVADNDTEQAAKLVEQYAKTKGYTERVYHGTNDFGFTKIDLSKSDDSQTFWATSSYTTAHTYSGDNNEGKTREIGKYPAQLKDLTPKKKIDLYKELSANENMKIDYIGKNDKDAKKNYLNKRLISAEREIYRTKPRTEKAIEKYNILKERFNTFKNKVFKGDFAKEYDDYYKALRSYNEEVNDIFGDQKIKDLDTYELRELGKVLSDNNEGIFLLNDSESYTLESEIDRYIKNYSKTSSGVYDFYANTDNFMTIDAKNENWNLISYKSDNPSIDTLRTYLKGISDEWNVSIEYDSKTKSFTAYKYGDPVEQSTISLKEATKLYQNEDEEEIQANTRDIAEDAMKQNYDGVVIKNVVDNGGRGEDFINPADVYIFFNPVEQVKSADPITYDDNGNVIPLAERFSKDHDDIRYSMANEGRPLSEIDSEGNELSKEQQEYFKDSKVRDEEGNLLVMYHGTGEDFNVFERDKIGNNTGNKGIWGKGFYFTDKKSSAEYYIRKDHKLISPEEGNIKEGYLNMTNPFYWESINTKDKMAKFIKDNGLRDDVLKWNRTLKNQMKPLNEIKDQVYFAQKLRNLGYDGIIHDETHEYIIFNSNQFKNIDNKQPTTNEDIRLSLKEEVTDRDIDKYRAVRDDIGKALKLLKGSKLDSKGNRKLAMKLRDTFGTKTPLETMVQDLEEIGTLIETKGIQNTDTTDRVKVFVTDILKSEKQVDPEIDNAIKSIRKQKIYLTDKDKKQITDYKQFWRDRFNTLNIVSEPKGAMAVDEFFTHLEQYQPEVYNAVVGDQYPDASTLVDLLNWIKTAKDDAYSLLDQYGDEAVEYFTNEVLNEYSNAKVENITNSRAKQRELYKNVGEMVDAIEGLKKTKDQASKEVLDRARKAQSELNLKLDEQRRNIENKYQKLLDETNKKLANEKSNTAKKIKTIQEKARVRERNRTDRLKRAEKRKVIRNTAGRILTTIRNPKINKHIPQPLKAPVKDLYETVEGLMKKFTPVYLNKQRDNALLKYTGDRLAIELDKIDAKENALTTQMETLIKALENFVEGKDLDGNDISNPYGDSDTYYEPIIKMLKNCVESTRNTHISKMDLEQLTILSNTLRAVERSTTERERPQKIVIEKPDGTPYETYKDISLAVQNKVKKYNYDKTDSVLLPYLDGRQLLRLLGGNDIDGVGHQLAEKIDEANLRKWDIEKELFKRLNPILEEKVGRTNWKLKSEVLRQYGKKDLIDVGFKNEDGEPILRNKDSLLREYANLLNDEYLNHAARGGITFADFKNLYSRQSKNEIYGKGSDRTANIDTQLRRVEEQIRDAADNEDYTLVRKLGANKANIIESKKDELRKIRENIENHLDDYDKKLLNVRKEIVRISTEWLNDEWEEVFNFRPFNVGWDEYYHIATDPNFTSGGDSQNTQQVIKNLSEDGVTVARRPHAGNPVLSGSFLFDLDEYIHHVADLIAFAGVQRDLNAIMKYTTDGFKSWQYEAEKKMPKALRNYTRTQQHLFGGAIKDDSRLDRAVATGRSLVSGGVLSPIPRIGVAQLPSITGFLRYVDKQAFFNAYKPKNKISRKVDGKNYSIQDIIDKYTGIMFSRGNSGFTLETADLKRDTNKYLRLRQKIDRMSKGWIYNMPTHFDSFALHHEFRMMLDQVRRERPDLAKTEKPELIVNGESELYKETARRFEKAVMETQPMFDANSKNSIQLSNSDIVKSFGAFKTQGYRYLNLLYGDLKNYESVKNDKTKSKAEKKKYKRILQGTISIIVSAMSMYAAFKMIHKKLVGHEDEDLTAGLIAKNMASPFIGVFIGGQQLVDAVYNFATGRKPYDVEILGTQLIKDAQDLMYKMGQALDGKGVDKVLEALEQFGKSAGIPVKNMHDEIDGIYRNIEDFIDNGEWDYSNERSDNQLLQDFIKGERSKDDLKKLGVNINDKTKFSNAVKKLYQDGEIDRNTAIKVMSDSGLYNDSKRKQPTDSYIEGKLEWWDIYNKYHDDYINGDSNEKASIRSKIALLPISNYYYHSKTNPHKRIVEYIKNNWKKTE